jgi:DNA-binding MarR family transcriptional regulator
VPKLRDEIKQVAPMAAEQEAYISVVRTADLLARGIAEVLKPYDLSSAQYNVLRILRGSTPSGLPCGDVSSRLVTREPDVTRLLDRLERRGLVSRTRSGEDRRVVVTRITPAGLEVLAELDESVAETHRRQFAGLSARQVGELVRLLELVRDSGQCAS